MLPDLAVRAFFVLASVCGLSLAACSSGPVVPAASNEQTTAPTAPRSAAASAAATPEPAPSTANEIRYVALGDSFTIGTSVKSRDRWPNQLARKLSSTGLELVGNLASNGATTEDVIQTQLRALPDEEPGFVSLLIGVNDVIRGVSVDAYRANLRTILHALMTTVPANRLLLVTTPDYTLTPRGAEFGDPNHQSELIRSFNDVLEKEAASLHVLAVDISPVADGVEDDRSLVADDNLHPSGKQYAGWVDLIAKNVRPLLRSDQLP